MALTVVTTLAGTVDVVEPISVDAVDLQIELLPGGEAQRQFTLHNSAVHPVWAGIAVSVEPAPVFGLSTQVDKDFIAEVPALGSDTWTYTFQADNGIEAGLYDLEVNIIRPDTSTVATYEAGLP